MEAARVAALRGHRVTLVERSDRLGGTLFFAALAYPENGRLLDYLVRQMDHPNIQLRLNTTVDAGLLAELQPDEILVGTGARRAAPAIEGAQQSHVWSGDELRRLMTGDRAEEIARAKLNLAERALFKAGGMFKVTDSTAAIQNLSKLWMPLGKRVVIIGAGLVGLELAEFLLDRGREVTVLDPGTHPGTELAIVRRWRVYDAVKKHGKLLMQSNVTRIERKEVVWTDKKGEEYRTPADSVVLAIGAEADSAVADQLQSLTGLRAPHRRLPGPGLYRGRHAFRPSGWARSLKILLIAKTACVHGARRRFSMNHSISAAPGPLPIACMQPAGRGASSGRKRVSQLKQNRLEPASHFCSTKD
ncbi:FAD-dependent oxidoreductase [Comamonas thiooxydans]|uniref:FAD-dependent oxidoreductase n=1 Tax=Comamonas thiooxydans TaxID=363952 RepID=UPI002115861B|nr:FAD-dependent oxidoreductase [Comamonas thiooxydans]UUE94136.1 NAD(P)/FAD-dependent oxidoreductase [Comamonas thiooxydans]